MKSDTYPEHIVTLGLAANKMLLAGLVNINNDPDSRCAALTHFLDATQ